MTPVGLPGFEKRIPLVRGVIFFRISAGEVEAFLALVVMGTSYVDGRGKGVIISVERLEDEHLVAGVAVAIKAKEGLRCLRW